ncbi:hypothetical protein GC088_09925 [Arthrobacter sp. JZ12]|uniref:hypothetical protein n=1 Tax=Arthrobacter sp. JZ12 TaxID=2654190 RepID=UPI002B4A7142|nr:hypothetical protein [Arthrobacter sp. JZ12]WRH25347.1 hypothetical protein GC088_09925 [Arthrobacter sp. JZ12]
MTNTSHSGRGFRSVAPSRVLRTTAMIGGLGVVVAVAVHLVWRNFGSDDFARSAELGGLFLYWWAFGAVVGSTCFVFALRSTRPAPLLDLIGVFAIASTVGVAVASTDFSTGRIGPVTLTVPLLFPVAHFLRVRWQAVGRRETAALKGGERS